MNSIPTLPPVYQHGSRPRGAKSVLVVDDFAPLNDLVVRYLSSCGFHVLTAQNGIQARKIAVASPEQDIDLLVTDLNMPGLRGDELAEWFATERPQTRMVMMADFIPLLQAGRQIEFLQKPFTFVELDAAIRKALTPAAVHSGRANVQSIAA